VEVLRFWEEEGVTVPEPYKRHIKVMLAPDRRNATELTFSQVLIYPESKTDYHTHDRPELIIVIAGRGVSVCEGKKTSIEPEMALWIPAGETHQIINNTDETLTLLTVFTPAYSAKELLEPVLKAAEKGSKAK
jgi:mannose-6-phosphate isomerase-like protein (cupin superfamily)